MHQFLRIFIMTGLAVLTALLSATAMAQQSLTLLAPGQVLEGFHAYTRGREVLSIRDYSFSPDYILSHQDPYVNLEVIELVLLVQALQLGGYHGEIKIKSASPQATIRKIEKGEALLGGVSIWRERTRSRNASLWVSDPIIRQGEFQLGLYGCDEGREIANEAALQQFKVSSHANWPMVTEYLQTLELEDLSLSSDWGQVVEQACSGNSDLVTAPFTTSKSMTLQHRGNILKPVTGVKLQVEGTRHFVISRLHPKGKRTYFSLQRGLRKLRIKGNIARALRQSGFLNQAASSWNFLK